MGKGKHEHMHHQKHDHSHRGHHMDEETGHRKKAHDCAFHEFTPVVRLACRAEPSLEADRNGNLVNAGDILTAHRIVTINGDGEEVEWDHIPIDDLCFINLGEDVGWVMNRNPVSNSIVLQPVYERTGTKSDEIRFNLRSLFGKKPYEYFIAGVIIVNGLFIWSEIDYPESNAYFYINLVFSILYLVEISAKIWAFGKFFFYSNWNCFDLTVTSITVFSDFAEHFVDPQTAKNMRTLAPVIRLLRLARLCNLAPGLKSLMTAFTSSLGALGWIMVFIAIWFFISGCLVTVIVGRKDFFPDSAAATVADSKRIRAKFDTVPHSMYSLFEVMAMEGWVGVVRPISRSQPGLVAFFFLFIFIAAFFLLNLVTAVVVDRTVQAQEEAATAAQACEGDEGEMVIFDMVAYLQKWNGGEDIILRKELMKLLEDDEMVEFLAKVEWDASTIENLCSVMDKHNEGKISLKALQNQISGGGKEISMMKWVRMQAEMTQRMEKNERILKGLIK
jgi:voltage-gated sodium channel